MNGNYDRLNVTTIIRTSRVKFSKNRDFQIYRFHHPAGNN